MDYIAYMLGIVSCAGAVGLLRHGWRSTTASHGLWTMACWLALSSALVLLCLGRGIMIGAATALFAFSLFGIVAVLLGAERRAERTRPVRVAEPESRLRSRWRGWVRGITAFLLAMFAAVTVGAAYAGIRLGAPADRVSIGSLVVPFIWAAFVVWALADRKILRPIIGMTIALAVSSAAIAWSVLA